MTPIALENEDHVRDAEYNKAMHGKTAKSANSLMAMLKKDANATATSIDSYFAHWDEAKAAKDETEEDRLKRRNMYATLTREYYVR